MTIKHIFTINSQKILFSLLYKNDNNVKMNYNELISIYHILPSIKFHQTINKNNCILHEENQKTVFGNSNVMTIKHIIHNN